MRGQTLFVKAPLLCVLTGCAVLLMARPVVAQLPFYTDDPAVTEAGVLHFEFFNEFDGLQSSQFPDLRQNTANFKINYGLKHGSPNADVSAKGFGQIASTINIGPVGTGTARQVQFALRLVF